MNEEERLEMPGVLIVSHTWFGSHADGAGGMEEEGKFSNWSSG